MGLSITTMAGAKAITVSYAANGQIDKSSSQAPTDKKGTDPTTGAAGIVLDDSGTIDLSKVQMLAWTVVAVLTFAYSSVNAVFVTESLGPSIPQLPGLPDIDPTLMILMGLGQGAYLGKKLVTVGTPSITSVDVDRTPTPPQFVLFGMAFGDTQTGSRITFDDQEINASVRSWSDSKIAFDVPSGNPSSFAFPPWTTNQTVKIGVNVAGQSAANPVSYEITQELIGRLAKDFKLECDQLALKIAPGESPKLTCTISSINSFQEDVTLSYLIDPIADIRVLFNPSTARFLSEGATTVSAGVTAPNGVNPSTYKLAIRGTAGDLSHDWNIWVTVT